MPALVLLKLTLKSVLTDIPHDAAAFVTYALLLAFVGFIYLGSRSGREEGSQPAEGPPQP